MIKCNLVSIVALAFALFLVAGCSSQSEKMKSICEDFEEVAQQTDNCDEMASSLERVQKRFARALDDAKNNPPADDEKDAMIEAVSGCTRAILEITSDPCSDNPAVRKHSRPSM